MTSQSTEAQSRGRSLSPMLGLTVTQSVREGLRIIMQIGPRCPTCGRAGEEMTLRQVAALTDVNHVTVGRFLHGKSVDSDTLDKLFEWVNARLPESAERAR